MAEDTERLFRFDPAERYELTLAQPSGRIVVYGSPLDEAGSKWRIEDAGTVDLLFEAPDEDGDDLFRAALMVRCTATIQRAPHGAVTHLVEQSTEPLQDGKPIQDRVRLWASRPNSLVHTIIALVANSPGGLTRSDLIDRIGRLNKSRNPYGAVASLMTSEGNAYGRALLDSDGIVSIHPDVREEVARHRWSIR